MKLLPDETVLEGKWVTKNGSVVNDDIADRIEWLLANWLKKITVTSDGWDILYQDPMDHRFWELNYPHGEMNGGGPPLLRRLFIEEVKNKYGVSLAPNGTK
jgi:hypothetical protein